MLDTDKKPKFVAPILDTIMINETKCLVNPVIKVSSVIMFRKRDNSIYVSFNNGGEHVKYSSIEFNIVKGEKSYMEHWFFPTIQERDREYSRLLNILT